MTEGSLLGKIVFNKRTGLMGEVVAEDGLTLTIDTQGVVKSVTRTTFNRWFRVVDDEPTPKKGSTRKKTPVVLEEPVQEAPEPEESSSESSAPEEKPSKKGSRINPSGDKGIGEQLADRFLEMVKDMANQDLDITVNPKNRVIVIRYNGKNVFECSVAKRRFNVLAHPNALTAFNASKATKILPKDWGWSLRAKFVFTSFDDVPLMKSIITDSLYYRQIKEEAK